MTVTVNLSVDNLDRRFRSEPDRITVFLYNSGIRVTIRSCQFFQFRLGEAAKFVQSQYIGGLFFYPGGKTGDTILIRTVAETIP